MTLADILVVMNGGRVEQIGKPLEVYQMPATTFVATFIGSPAMNLMPLRRRRAGTRRRHGGEAGILGIRPEDFVLSSEPAPPAASPSTSPSRRSSGSALKPMSTASAPAGRRPAVSAKPGELPPGESSSGFPAPVAPAIGARIRAVAARDKLHLFSADGRKRIDL